MISAGLVICTVSHAGKWPWQRRVGNDVDIHHKRQHERVSPDMWPAEPPSPAEVDVEKFARALKSLCGAERMPGDRSVRYSRAIIENAQAFEVDPFVIAGLIFDQSRCLPKTPDHETKYGLSRIDVEMHAPHIRGKKYKYFVLVDGEWEERFLRVEKYPFNKYKAAYPMSNIYWTAAILRVFKEQKESLRQAFPASQHRHHVAHWLFGDNVRNTEPEDRILTARRQMLDYYNNRGPVPAGEYEGLPLVSPLGGTPRMVLDDFGSFRGTRKAGHVHQGLDICAETDEPILAVADGRVVFAGVDLPGAGSKPLTPEEANVFPEERMGAGGLYVAINHGNGLRTYYMHMDTLSVTDRQEVKAGDVIGTVGRSGSTQSGAHLHLEFRLGTQRLDPATYLKDVLVDPKRIKETANPSN